MDTHPVPWAGRNHLARMTDNLERTTRLWHGVMGAPLVAILGMAWCTAARAASTGMMRRCARP